jgi:hypothetical protein
LNRPVKWDAQQQSVISDDEANSMLPRVQRKGDEITV